MLLNLIKIKHLNFVSPIFTSCPKMFGETSLSEYKNSNLHFRGALVTNVIFIFSAAGFHFSN